MNNGDIVVDSDGTMGIVINCTDSHNIEVSYIPRGCITGGIGLYCNVEKCRDYNPVYVVKQRECIYEPGPEKGRI